MTSLFNECMDDKEKQCQLGCGLSNIATTLQPAIDQFKNNLLDVGNNVLRKMKKKVQRGKGKKYKKTVQTGNGTRRKRRRKRQIGGSKRKPVQRGNGKRKKKRNF